MIKICLLEFEELQSKDHWVTFAQFGSCASHKTVTFDNYHELGDAGINLDPEDAWQIAFDQSTSNSGVFIKNYKNTKAIMMEMNRSRGESADDFIFNFEMLVHQLCKGVKFTHLLYERPITTESFRSSQVLFQLEGMLRALVKRYEEFHAARLDYIENSSWRSVVVDTKKFSGYSRKGQTFMSINEYYPWVMHYGTSIGEDYDVFEAMGVMFGWFINSYDALGRPYVRGDKFNGSIGGFILPGVSAKSVAEEFSKVGLKVGWFVENPRKSIYENIASGLEHYAINCVEMSTQSAMLALYVECNLKWDDPKKLTLVIVPANFVDTRLYSITGREFHFVF